MTGSLQRFGRCVLFAGSIAIGLASAPNGADAQSVADGEAAWLEADFERARGIFEAALSAPGSDAAALLSAHRHLAVIASMERDEDAARHHAAMAVALSHDVTAPDGAPSAAGALFDAARAAAGGEMALELDAGDPHAATPSVSATLRHAPDGLVERLHLLCQGDSSLRAEETGPPPTVRLVLSHPEATPRCEAEALSASGARLLDASLSLALSGAADVVPTRSEAAPAGDDTLVFVLIGVGAAVLVGAAIVLAVVLVSESSSGPNVGGIVVRGW